MRQDPSANVYPIGLRWDVPEEQRQQLILKNQLMLMLNSFNADDIPDGQSLAQWLRKLPVTGRAFVTSADSRWLETNSRQDPILRVGHHVELPIRPLTATVVLEDGALCQVPYRAGVMTLDYLRACAADADQRDTAWVAQPDGRNFKFGISEWNAQSQEPPGAGAWIWAPSRKSGLPSEFSDKLIKLLATQGIAKDGAGRSVGAAPEMERTIPANRARDLPITASDWGESGLLQTPTARMAPAGEVRFTYSVIQPYSRATVMFQPLDWLEGGFRYSQVNNQLYDPTLLISSQSYKDKSVDAKIRIWEESRWIPQLAIGARDLGGTGLFAGEYVVANKRAGDLDFSLGLGWGYLGARANLKNPLSLLSEQFSTRQGGTATGTANNKAYFRGPTSLFGGVQWQTPLQPLVLKVEYDGNDYKNEPFNNPIKSRIPLNLGAVYRYSQTIDLSAGIERGNRGMIGVTLHGGLDKLMAAKLFDPAVPEVREEMPENSPQWESTANDIQRQTGWSVEAIGQRGNTIVIRVSSTFTAYKASRLDKMMAVLHRDSPRNIQYFEVDFTERGLALGTKSIRRNDWVALQTQGLSPFQREDLNIEFTQGPLSYQPKREVDTTNIWRKTTGRLTGGISPSLWQSVGGPDSFLLYQLGLQAGADYRISNKTWISGAGNLRLIDNYDKFKYTAPSDLPRVRTFAREYATTSRVTISNLQITHAEKITDNNFVLVYGGMLEAMFGGIGGEYMYRRNSSRWAFGIDANRVKQRGFDQKLDFRDYEANTGYATVYWDTGWNDVSLAVSAGQYLAGDRGATVNVSRRFNNGVVVGAYATKTNVSAAQFGEGSFDKGIFVTFPFDAILPKSTNTSGSILWQPLIRDGGARLNRSQTLYGLTSSRDLRAFSTKPAQQSDILVPTGTDTFSDPKRP